jgi:membrane protease subunit (stomatin/prohibitin family)
MPRRLIRTAVVVGGAAHVGAKRGEAAAQQKAAQQQGAQEQAAQEQAAQQQPAPAAPSDAEEIQKYATMKEQGLITEEEFAAKKKAILGI